MLACGPVPLADHQARIEAAEAACARIAGLTSEGWCAVTGQPTNWAGNVVYRADRVHRPRSVDELQDLVSGSHQVRALGSGHSFNRIADTAGVLVSVADLPPVLGIDPRPGTGPAGARVRC